MLLPAAGHDAVLKSSSLFVLKTKRRVCESEATSTPLLQNFVAKMSFLVRPKKMHGGICKGVLKVGPGEAQKGLNSEAQKNAQRHCEAQFQEDFRLHLAKFWRSLGTFLGGCLWSNLSRKDSKIQEAKGSCTTRENVTRGTLPTCKGGRGRPQLQ
jgi:hypothetical protein